MAEQNDGRDSEKSEPILRQRSGATESSGSESVDKLNESARSVLGDAEVDYGAQVGHTPVDEELIQERAAAHGDVVTRNPDGSHNVTSVAPSPADPHTPADARETQSDPQQSEDSDGED